jgi:hypothetical protein
MAYLERVGETAARKQFLPLSGPGVRIPMGDLVARLGKNPDERIA